MENKIIPFNYGDNLIRVVNDEETGEQLWVAKDVCKVLEYKDVSMTLSKLDEDEKGTKKICTLGGDQNMMCVTESGLYTLILRSNKPEAKPFKRWVTHEVLPTIRKTGSYGTGADMSGVVESMNAIAQGFSGMMGMLQVILENQKVTTTAYLTPDQLDQIKLKAAAAARTLSDCHPQLTWGEAMRYVYMELNSRMGVFSYTHISGHDYEDAITLLDCMKLSKEIESQTGVKPVLNDIILQSKAYR